MNMEDYEIRTAMILADIEAGLSDEEIMRRHDLPMPYRVGLYRVGLYR